MKRFTVQVYTDNDSSSVGVYTVNARTIEMALVTAFNAVHVERITRIVAYEVQPDAN